VPGFEQITTSKSFRFVLVGLLENFVKAHVDPVASVFVAHHGYLDLLLRLILELNDLLLRRGDVGSESQRPPSCTNSLSTRFSSYIGISLFSVRFHTCAPFTRIETSGPGCTSNVTRALLVAGS